MYPIPCSFNVLCYFSRYYPPVPSKPFHVATSVSLISAHVSNWLSILPDDCLLSPFLFYSCVFCGLSFLFRDQVYISCILQWPQCPPAVCPRVCVFIHVSSLMVSRSITPCSHSFASIDIPSFLTFPPLCILLVFGYSFCVVSLCLCSVMCPPIVLSCLRVQVYNFLHFDTCPDVMPSGFFFLYKSFSHA